MVIQLSNQVTSGERKIEFTFTHTPDQAWHLDEVLFTIWAAMLYRIYKHEPKANDCMCDTTLTWMLWNTHGTNIHKHSRSSKMVKIPTILAEETWKFLENQIYYQKMYCVWLHQILLIFIHDISMIIRIWNTFYLVWVRCHHMHSVDMSFEVASNTMPSIWPEFAVPHIQLDIVLELEFHHCSVSYTLPFCKRFHQNQIG